MSIQVAAKAGLTVYHSLLGIFNGLPQKRHFRKNLLIRAQLFNQLNKKLSYLVVEAVQSCPFPFPGHLGALLPLMHPG